MKNFTRAIKQIDQVLAWAAKPLKNAETGKPYLIERDGILSLHFNTLSIQSEMCIDTPDELVVGYTRTMMSFLLFEPSPKQIAMIGLGGGSLAKYCYRYLPGTEITVVEIDPEVIALRNEFAIPADDSRFQVLPGDGAEWVVKTESRPEVLLVDGFDADGLPDQLSNQRFYDDCFATLANNGIMVVNLWNGYPRYSEYVTRIHNSFAGNIVTIDADDSVNRIVFALKNAELPLATTIRRHAKLLSESHPLNFQAKSNKLIRALAFAGT